MIEYAKLELQKVWFSLDSQAYANLCRDGRPRVKTSNIRGIIICSIQGMSARGCENDKRQHLSHE